MKSKNLNFKKEKADSSSSGDLFADHSQAQVEDENKQLGSIQPIENQDFTPIQIDVSYKDKKKSRKKKFFTVFFIFLLAFVLIGGALAYFFVITPIQKVVNNYDDIKSNASSLAKDFNSKDVSNIDTYFNNIQTDIGNINTVIKQYDFLSTTDATKGYYNNFQIASSILTKTTSLIQSTLPQLKDVLKATGFRVNKDDPMPVATTDSTSTDAQNGAFTLILQQMPKFLDLYNGIEPQIEDILAQVKKIDPNYVPDIAGYNLKSTLESTYGFIDQFPTISAETTSFLKYIPDLVGANTPAKYLLILQNETEMRSSGGLLTAYGFMSMDKGQFGQDIFLTDMWNFQYDLWATGETMPYDNIYGQNWMMNFPGAQCGATELRIQDAGIYPDLHEVGNMIQNYYKIVQPVFPDKYPNYDYILFLDENFATNLINLIQPLDVPNYGTVTGESLYDFIKGETDQNVPDDVRKAIIKAIANAAKDKFLNLPVSKLPDLISTLIGSFQRRDLAIESPFNADTQKYLDSYGMSGEFAQNFNGDYFHMNEAQNCSLKLNKFIRDDVTQNVYIQNDGSIKRDVKVDWLQTQIFQPGLEKQYSPTLDFSYRAWVRFMTPDGSSNFVSDGYDDSGYLYYRPQVYQDDIMNKQVSDNIIQFDHRRFTESDPELRGSMNVSYNLPSSINYTKDGKYVLLLQKHPGKSWGEQYTITVHDGSNSNTINFTLDRDKVLTYKNGIITVDNYDKSLDWVTGLANAIPWDKLSSK